MKQREIDTLIRDALKNEDREFLSSLDEPSLAEQVTEMFRGRWRFINAIGMVVSLGLFAAGAYSIVQFFQTEDVLMSIRWGAAGFVGMAGVSYMKLWYWLELERHAVTREIKRLELQVAHLAATVSKG